MTKLGGKREHLSNEALFWLGLVVLVVIGAILTAFIGYMKGRGL